MRKFFVSFISFIILVCSGCASLSRESTAAEGENSSRGPASEVNRGGALQTKTELDKRISESDITLKDDEDNDGPEEVLIPIEINNRVAAWINHFSERDRERTIRYFERGSAFKKQMEKMLEQSDVPKELFYLAMIESGYVQHAKSHAEAVGIWQLIPGTAKNYGLKINRYVDERRSWIKSTEAAIRYLKDLRNVFGSWYLAFAAYNAGEYRIVRSIMVGKTRDFWTLAEGNMLPVETLNYVPKFMAAMIVGKNPAKYNIVFQPDPQIEDFDLVEAPVGVSLKDLARVTGIPQQRIQDWNPDILRNVIPYDHTGKFEIYLPKDDVAKFESKRDQIAQLKRTGFGNMAQAEREHEYAIYVVQHGDTLSSISRTLGVSARTLKRINRIELKRLHPGQRLRYLNSLNADSAQAKIYIVKKNETLQSIAAKNKITAEQIATENNLKSLAVVPGQKLRVPLNFAVRENGRDPGSAGEGFYIVKRGDTLGAIARRYQTSVKRLKRANHMHKNKLIPGQELRIN